MDIELNIYYVGKYLTLRHQNRYDRVRYDQRYDGTHPTQGPTHWPSIGWLGETRVDPNSSDIRSQSLATHLKVTRNTSRA